ncbi:MAG: hypothetical protein HUK20_11180 [Fibrobacter sp.]|nr:hypothetical protein [Fibrobacter sp.]
MSFFKFFTTSVSLLVLCACQGNEYTIAFNTQSVPPQSYYLESTLNAILPVDSLTGTPEAMNTHLVVKATNSLLTAYDNGSAKFEMKIDSVDYKSDKRSIEEFTSMERYMSTEHFQYKMAKDGFVTDPVIEDSVMLGTEALNLIRLFLKVQPLLPGKPVALGEKWERTVEIPGSALNTVVYKSFTLQDLYVHDGAQMAKIGMNLKYKEVADSTSDLRMDSQGFIMGSGTILFDMTHGTIFNATLEITGTVSLNDVVAESSIPEMRVIQKIKLRGEINDLAD